MYKACMVASVNMTGPNIDTYYSSVIPLCSMRTVVFLAELKNIETCTGDISNSYFTSSTIYKILFNAGPDFSPFRHTSHLLHIKTLLYDLRGSGSRFHYCLSDALTALCLVPLTAGCNIWMRNEGDYYSYVACYFDGLIVVHN